MFKDNLVYFRKKNNMTQEELAKSLGTTRSRISMYELGKREPSFEMLEAIADVFNINMSTLLGEDDMIIKEAPTAGSRERDILIDEIVNILKERSKQEQEAILQLLRARSEGYHKDS